MKFAPEHFPAGTVVRVKDLASIFRQEDGTLRLDWPVVGVCRNGYYSYLIDTGIKNPAISGNVLFNVDFVESIVSCGTGPVLIDNGHYGTPQVGSEAWSRFAEDVEAMSILDGEQNKLRKNYYNTVSPISLVMWELGKFMPANAIVDTEELAGAVLNQSWTKQKRLNENFTFFVINKKRFAKFLRKNANRFLLDLSKAQRAHDNDMDHIMNEDFNERLIEEADKEDFDSAKYARVFQR